jgi:hypothetical protein
VVEDAHADRVSPVQPRRGDQRRSGFLQRRDELRVALLVPFVEVAAEADDAQRRRRRELERVEPTNALGCELGEVQGAVNRSPKRVHAERAHRQPNLQRARRARQLDPVIGEVHLAFVCGRLRQVVGRDLEGAAERRVLPYEDAPTLVRLVQPLVGVERDRVGTLDAV